MPQARGGSVIINMNETFRYPNDNREGDPESHEYPSQNKQPPGAKKGEVGYYGNDNGGYYGNSNRPQMDGATDKTDPLFKYPNSNIDQQNS